MLMNLIDAVIIHQSNAIIQVLMVFVRLMEHNAINNFNNVALGAVKMMQDVKIIENFVNILQAELE